MADTELNLLRTYLLRLAVWLTTLAIGQMLTGVWWASRIDERVHQLERRTDHIEACVYRASR
jgi:hypothetical protein